MMCDITAMLYSDMDMGNASLPCHEAVACGIMAVQCLVMAVTEASRP